MGHASGTTCWYNRCSLCSPEAALDSGTTVEQRVYIVPDHQAEHGFGFRSFRDEDKTSEA